MEDIVLHACISVPREKDYIEFDGEDLIDGILSDFFPLWVEKHFYREMWE